jgi:beta-ketodecanoyl-[acyl-carrier-protein] synthase
MVACSSATFGIQDGGRLSPAARSGRADGQPEVCSAHLNFKVATAIFIFGDVATAVIVEIDPTPPAPAGTSWAQLRRCSRTASGNFGFLVLMPLAEGRAPDHVHPAGPQVFRTWCRWCCRT